MRAFRAFLSCPDTKEEKSSIRNNLFSPKLTTSLNRHRRAKYPFTAAHSHQKNHAPL